MVEPRRSRKPVDDPLGQALAGPAPVAAEPVAAPKATMIDLDAFTTSPGELYAGDNSADEARDPVVAYDDDLAGSRTYTLVQKPKVNGVILSTITLRMPEQQDIDDFYSGGVDGTRGMLARLTGLHPVVIKRLKWPDAEAVFQLYRDIVPSFMIGE